MLKNFVKSFNRYFGRPEIVVLLATLVAIMLVFAYAGQLLAPVFASIVVAYLLQWPIQRLEKYRVPHALSVLVIYLTFMSLVVLGILVLIPLMWHQLLNLFNAMPSMLAKGQALLMDLPRRYPSYVSALEIQDLINEVKSQSLSFGQDIVSASFRSLSTLVSLCIYLILVPLLVYFFLMDKRPLLAWVQGYLPQKRQLLATVWLEVYAQIGRYVRGKVVEVLIVSGAFYILFVVMHFNYAILLAALVGVSVIIPYVGAVIVTIPVFIIAFLQWGLVPYLSYFVLLYGVLIALDANVLVPLLFSEAVNLHPVAIILAVLIFGGLLGFWGVFFAIPLASVVKAVLGVLTNRSDD